MADLTRHILQDAGIWSGPSSQMYKPDCESKLYFPCLSITGWFFTIIFTYTGFACLIGGTVWAADLVPKIKHAWKNIHNRHQIEQ